MIRWTSALTGSTIHEADARTVAAGMPAGCAALLMLDGPYGMGKADWDRVPRGGSLVDLYRGHLDDVDRLAAASATLYVWNTAEGWAELHPEIVRRGWVYASLIIWHKPDGAAIKAAHEAGARAWPEVMEVCGMYQREAWAPNTCAGQEVAYAAGKDERNIIREFLRAEWIEAGLTFGADGRKALRCAPNSGLPSHFFTVSQWMMPTWENWQRMAEYAQAHGPARERQYLVHPSQWPDGGLRASYDHLRASYDHLRASYDHLRAEYEASRPPFTCPLGVGNVWSQGQVSGPERLKWEDGATLHPCQKPLVFAERMIRASSRPGDVVWVPFGGTCREVLAAERIARGEASEARRVVCCEMNQDGRDYLGPVVAQIEGVRPDRKGQIGLFGSRS